MRNLSNGEVFVAPMLTALVVLDWKRGRLAEEAGVHPNTVTNILKGLGGDDPRAAASRKEMILACERWGYRFDRKWRGRFVAATAEAA